MIAGALYLVDGLLSVLIVVGMASEIPVHLRNAMKVWGEILQELSPEYTWVVSIEQLEADERELRATMAIRAIDDAGAVPDDPHPVLDGDAAAAADAVNDDGFDEAA